VTADVRLEELVEEFDFSYLHGQYACGRHLSVVPDRWRVAQVEDLTLTHHESLPALDLTDAGGNRLGWLLGHPVDPEACAFPASPVRAPIAADNEDFEQRFGDWLYRHGGRFVAILAQPEPLAFPDPYALLPVLFRSETECIASNPLLLPDRDGGLTRAGVVSQWFPLATTSLEGVDQVLANHVLSLKTWRQRRHWPKRAPEPTTVEAGAERIAATIEPVAVAAARAGNARMGLTAGGDTRVLLACMRGVVREFEFVTLLLGDDLATTDAIWAPTIATRFGLAHRMVGKQTSTPRDVRLFHYRTGAMNGEVRGWSLGPTWAELGTPSPFLAGGAGEVLRAQHFRGLRRIKGFERAQSDVLEPADVLRLSGAPPELRDRAEEWLAGLPRLAALDALQLLYIELVKACWYGTSTLAFPERDPALHPMTHRSVTEAALGVPFRDRWNDRLRTAVVRSRWPDLLDIPFNRDPLAIVWRKHLSRARGYTRAAIRRVSRGVASARS
jgi:hypothetical protein